MRVKTWLPIFNGFYETSYNIPYNAEFDYLLFDNPKTENQDKVQWYLDNVYDFIDYKGCENKVAKECCKFIESEIKDFLDSNCKITFENVYSPTQYNYETDSINIEIDIDIDKIMTYLTKHKDDYQKYIEKKYTSYDGFCSHYANTLEYWLNKDNISDKHELGAALDFILTHNNSDIDYDILSDVLENVCVLNYIGDIDTAYNDSLKEIA